MRVVELEGHRRISLQQEISEVAFAIISVIGIYADLLKQHLRVVYGQIKIIITIIIIFRLLFPENRLWLLIFTHVAGPPFGFPLLDNKLSRLKGVIQFFNNFLVFILKKVIFKLDFLLRKPRFSPSFNLFSLILDHLSKHNFLLADLKRNIRTFHEFVVNFTASLTLVLEHWDVFIEKELISDINEFLVVVALFLNRIYESGLA